MNFVNPLLFAAGMACLAIPLLVHLQRRRQPKRLVFSTLRLMDPSLRTSRKKRKITDWPLFLLRLLAVLFFAFVFSKFFLAGWVDPPQLRREAIALVIDRSASMRAQGSVGQVLDEAIESGVRSLKETGRSSQIAVILSPPVEDDASILWGRPADMESVVRDIQPSFRSGNLNQAIERAVGSLDRFGSDFPKMIHLISDLQSEAIAELDSLVLPADVSIRVTKVGDLESVNGGFEVGVRGRDVLRGGLYRHSTAGQEAISVADAIYGQGAVSDELSWKARSLPSSDSGRVMSVPYTSGEAFGWYGRKLTSRSEDAWGDDDIGYDAFYIQKPLPVLMVEPKATAEVFLQKSFFVTRALSPENYREEVALQFDIRPTTPEKLGDLLEGTAQDATRALVVLPDVPQLSVQAVAKLKSLIRSGGGLLLFGGETLNSEFYNSALSDLMPVEISGVENVTNSVALTAVTARHELWGELDSDLRRRIRQLPLTRRHQVTSSSEARVLATFQDNVPFIAERRYGKGNVLFVNASADRAWGKWQTDGTLFVVTTHLLALRAAEQNEDRWRNAETQGIAGTALTVAVPEDQRLTSFMFNEQQVVPSPQSGELILQLPERPGLYPLTASDGQVHRLIAVNLAREESDFSSVQSVVVQRQLEKLRRSPDGVDASLLKADSDSPGTLFWRIILILLALLLAGETLISNRFSAEKTEPAQGTPAT